MTTMASRSARLVLTAAVGILTASSAMAYTVSYLDGGSWNTVYAQGFSTSLGASPDPALANGSSVFLSQFQFFKSGNSDGAANIQLGIFNTMYPNTTGLTTNSANLVGLSLNTIANTSGLSTGDAISFNFNNLQLSYGSDYSAIFLNVGSDGSLTPVLVSALTANYADAGGGDFHPTSNYGTESQFQYTTSDFISGGFFSAFNYAGDANFNAVLAPVPEPTTLSLLGGGLFAFALSRRARRAK